MDAALEHHFLTEEKRGIHCSGKAGVRIGGAAFEQVTGAGPGTFYRMVKA